MFVDVAASGDSTYTQWIAESGIVDLVIFAGPTPADVQRQYAALTGTTAMPQMFSIGYIAGHQWCGMLCGSTKGVVAPDVWKHRKSLCPL